MPAIVRGQKTRAATMVWPTSDSRSCRATYSTSGNSGIRGSLPSVGFGWGARHLHTHITSVGLGRGVQIQCARQMFVQEIANAARPFFGFDQEGAHMASLGYLPQRLWLARGGVELLAVVWLIGQLVPQI